MLGWPATILEHFDGRTIVRFEGKDLRYREIMEKEPVSGGNISTDPRAVPPSEHSS
jgi:hypothetical protein